MTDTDARLSHPWLRIDRVLRAMLHTRWSAEAWPQVKAEFTKALVLKSQIRRAGWFNCGPGAGWLDRAPRRNTSLRSP
jgi:hypothetical protein